MLYLNSSFSDKCVLVYNLILYIIRKKIKKLKNFEKSVDNVLLLWYINRAASGKTKIAFTLQNMSFEKNSKKL